MRLLGYSDGSERFVGAVIDGSVTGQPERPTWLA